MLVSSNQHYPTTATSIDLISGSKAILLSDRSVHLASSHYITNSSGQMSNRMSIDFLTDSTVAASESVLHPSPFADFADSSLGPGSGSAGIGGSRNDRLQVSVSLTNPIPSINNPFANPASAVVPETTKLFNMVDRRNSAPIQLSDTPSVTTISTSSNSDLTRDSSDNSRSSYGNNISNSGANSHNMYNSNDGLAALVRAAVDTTIVRTHPVPLVGGQQRNPQLSPPLSSSFNRTTKPWMSTPSFVSQPTPTITTSSKNTRTTGFSSVGSRSPSPDVSDYNSTVDVFPAVNGASVLGSSLSEEEIERLFRAARSNKNLIKGWRDAAMLALLLDLKLSCQKIADLRYRDVRGILDGTFSGIYRFGKDKSIPVRAIGCHEITACAIIGWTNAVKSAYGWIWEDDAPLFVPLAFPGDIVPQTARQTSLKRDAVSKVFTALKGTSGVPMNKEVVNRTHFRKFRPQSARNWLSNCFPHGGVGNIN